MSFIIGNKCVDCMDMGCVSVCPVDCINGPINISGAGEEVDKYGIEAFPGGQLYIDPDTCIDCGACVPECPVDAIYRDEKEAIEMDDEESIHKNYEFYGQIFSKNF
jgi:NAD-dependent dihydropyrimidine dehydrogenase PreA subunit